MKKILSLLLTLTLVFSFLCIGASSASAIRLTEETYPVEIVKGSTFSAYGIVTSDYNIAAVTLCVVDSNGETAFTYTGKPGTKTYDIHIVDYLLTFSKLDVGEYTYTITATDSQTSGVVLLCKNFRVVESATASSLKLTGANKPETIISGKTFSIYGTVTSDYNITSVTCSVYSSGGTLQFTKTAEPNAKSYSLSNLDKYMTFSRLTAGKYTYTVKASDEKNSNMVLLSAEFKVVETPSGSSIKLASENYPTAFSEGSTFSVEGIVSSDFDITAVTVGVYSSSGAVQFAYTAKPGTKSYNIHNIDYLMTFSKLKAGSYIYRITASDTYTKDVKLLEKSFTVTTFFIPESQMKPVKWNVVDLSKWNEFTSWDDLSKAVDAVILRVGYRATGNHSIGLDPVFEHCYNEAAARNMHIGCYFYSAALSEDEAIEEAEYVLYQLKRFNCKMDMPIYFDMETEDQVDLSASYATKIARAFCNTISEAGYYPGIYCNKYFARDELIASQLNDISFWIAEYGSSCTYTGPYGMWQFSEKGYVAGISGYVDLNYCYYDYPLFIKNNGYNGLGTPVVVEKPTYTIAAKNGVKVNNTSKTVSRVASGLTGDSFKKTYISTSSNVSTVFSNTVGGKLATGTVITFINGDKALAAYTVSVLGDIDGNAAVNSSDALNLLEYTIGKKKLSDLKKLSADFNGDGKIDSSDALGVLQFAVRNG